MRYNRYIIYVMSVLVCAMAIPAQAGTLTTEGLELALAGALEEEGTGDKLRTSVIGHYPSVLYEHPTGFAPDIRFTKIDAGSRRFVADIVLKEAETDTMLGRAVYG